MLAYYSIMAIWAIVYFLNRHYTYGLVFEENYTIAKDRKRFYTVLVCGLVLLILMGLKASSVGTDTEAYRRSYEVMRYMSLSDFKYSIDSEVGFKVVQWFFFHIGFNWQSFLFIDSAFVVIAMGRFLYRYCINIFLGFYLYMTIGLFAMNMTGVRQSLAVAIVLIATEFAQKHKIIPFLILTIIAGTIHYSAFIFIPVYLVFLLKFRNKKQLLIVILSPVVVQLASSVLLSVITRFALNKYTYSGYFDTLNITQNPLVEIVAIFILLGGYICLVQGRIDISDREFHFFVLTGVYVSCIELANVVYMAGRLSFYFIFFVNVMITNVVYRIEAVRLRYIALIAVIVFPLLYFAISVPGSSYRIDAYRFFWDNQLF